MKSELRIPKHNKEVNNLKCLKEGKENEDKFVEVGLDLLTIIEQSKVQLTDISVMN